MSLLKLQIKTLLSLSKLYVGILVVLAGLFHILLFVEHQSVDSIPLKKLISILLIPSCIFTLSLASNLHKLKATYLWSTNSLYRLSLIKAAYLVSLSFTLLTIVPVASVVTIWQVLLIVGAALAFLDSGFGSFKASIIIPTATFAWVLVAIANPNSFALFALLLATYGVVKLLINLDFIKFSKHIKAVPKARKATSFNDPYVWSCKMARWFAPLANTNKKDFDWMITFPQTKLGLLAVYFGLITMPIAWIQKDIVALFMLYGVFVFVLSLQGAHDFHRSKEQLKPFAHLLGNTNKLKQRILLSLQKMMIVNLIIFTILSQLAMHWLSKTGFSSELLIFTGLLGVLICATTPWFLCFNFICDFKRVVPQLMLVLLYCAIALLLYMGITTLSLILVVTLWLLLCALLFVTGWYKYKSRGASALFAMA